MSPTPDIRVHKIDRLTDKFIVIASDGLWGVMEPDESVHLVHAFDTNRDYMGGEVSERLEMKFSSACLLRPHFGPVLFPFLSFRYFCSLSLSFLFFTFPSLISIRPDIETFTRDKLSPSPSSNLALVLISLGLCSEHCQVGASEDKGQTTQALLSCFLRKLRFLQKRSNRK